MAQRNWVGVKSFAVPGVRLRSAASAVVRKVPSKSGRRLFGLRLPQCQRRAVSGVDGSRVERQGVQPDRERSEEVPVREGRDGAQAGGANGGMTDKAFVIMFEPQAYVRYDGPLKYTICRPRKQSDPTAVVKYVELSDMRDSEASAWLNAAAKLS